MINDNRIPVRRFNDGIVKVLRVVYITGRIPSEKEMKMYTVTQKKKQIRQTVYGTTFVRNDDEIGIGDRLGKLIVRDCPSGSTVTRPVRFSIPLCTSHQHNTTHCFAIASIFLLFFFLFFLNSYNSVINNQS